MNLAEIGSAALLGFFLANPAEIHAEQSRIVCGGMPADGFVPAVLGCVPNRVPESVLPRGRCYRGIGPVIFHATIDDSGNVIDAKVLRSTSIPAVNTWAETEVLFWKFQPARFEGRAAASCQTVTLPLKL